MTANETAMIGSFTGLPSNVQAGLLQLVDATIGLSQDEKRGLRQGIVVLVAAAVDLVENGPGFTTAEERHTVHDFLQRVDRFLHATELAGRDQAPGAPIPGPTV